MSTLDSYLRGRGIKGREFAARIGVSEPHLSRLRRGGSAPSLEIAFKIERETDGEVPASSWVGVVEGGPQASLDAGGA